MIVYIYICIYVWSNTYLPHLCKHGYKLISITVDASITYMFFSSIPSKRKNRVANIERTPLTWLFVCSPSHVYLRFIKRTLVATNIAIIGSDHPSDQPLNMCLTLPGFQHKKQLTWLLSRLSSKLAIPNIGGHN